MASLISLPLPSLWQPPAHRTLMGALAAGATLTNATPVSEAILTGNLRFLTVRFLASAAGTLAFAFVRSVGVSTAALFLGDGAAGNGYGELNPAALTKYATGAPSSVAVTASTEAILQVTANGEWYGLLTYTPSASGAVTWCDVSAL